MKSIWVAGDFFNDEFNIGHIDSSNPVRFHTEKTVLVPGGAGNTMANLRHMHSGRCDVDMCETGFPKDDCLQDCLQRWIVGNETVLEHWKQNKEMQNPWGCLLKLYEKTEYNALVVSDYGKGFADHPVPQLPFFDLLVVDSKYRTAPIQELKKYAGTTIWRCTGNEYCVDYAQNFDWVVHTDGPNAIFFGRLFEYCGHWLMPCTSRFVPPEIEVVDTCGAGDTFTAALTAQLVQQAQKEIERKHFRQALTLAISAAQNVCMKPYTAVTDVKLEQ